MIIFSIKIAIFFIILIYLIHHLFIFFRDTLTLPKNKDIVSSTNKNISKILDTLQNNNNNIHKEIIPDTIINTENILPIPIEENTTMKQELKNFLKKQINSNDRVVSSNSITDNFSLL